MRLYQCALATILGATLQLLPARADALAVLEVRLSNISCGISSAVGVQYSTCNTSVSESSGSVSFSAVLGEGQSAFVNATLDYVYRDAGLILDSPGIIILDRFTVLDVTHEAGALRVFGNLCREPWHCMDPAVFYGGTWDETIVLGLNDRPDRISARIGLSSVGTINPEYFDLIPGFTKSVGVSVGWISDVYSATPPIPEPRTFALMLAGLGCVAAAVRRKSVAVRTAAV